MDLLLPFLFVPALLGLLAVGGLGYFIYQFIMNSTSPLIAMKAVYIYVAALLGVILAAFGFMQLLEIFLRAFLDPRYIFMLADISAPLAMFITGKFLLIPHVAMGLHFHWNGFNAAPKASAKKK